MTREDTLLDRARASLAAAPADRHSPFRSLQLATAGADGTPELRTLVLRRFEGAPPVATFHADRRSPKIAAIAARPAVALLAWAAAEQLQVRMAGRARVHAGDDVARAEWDALSSNARKTYALAAVPGTEVTDAEADARAADAFAQFAVIRVTVASFDVLELGPEGAQFRVRTKGGDAVRVGP